MESKVAIVGDLMLTASWLIYFLVRFEQIRAKLNQPTGAQPSGAADTTEGTSVPCRNSPQPTNLLPNLPSAH